MALPAPCRLVLTSFSFPRFCPFCSKVCPRALRTSSTLTEMLLTCEFLHSPRLVSLLGTLLVATLLPSRFQPGQCSSWQGFPSHYEIVLFCHRAPKICLFLLKEPKYKKKITEYLYEPLQNLYCNESVQFVLLYKTPIKAFKPSRFCVQLAELFCLRGRTEQDKNGQKL